MNEQILNKERILSIDVVRGFDMLLIIFADQFFTSLHKGVGSSFTGALAKQFHHPEWFGSAFYDIIMPLFLFIVGAVIPFSMDKIIKGNTKKNVIYRKLIRRFIILFILGWIVQGNLLALSSREFHIFSNTLQAIAVGYFFSSLAYIHLTKKLRYLLFAGCLIIYTLLLTIPVVPGLGRSELLPDHSFAIYIDRLVMGGFDDGTQYSWLLSGFGFVATTLSGLFAGELIKSNLPRKNVVLQLLLYGLAGVLLGLVIGIWHPVVKKLWTSSFVLLSSGVCFLLMSFFYWIIDARGKYKWAFPLKVIGMNAITGLCSVPCSKFPSNR